MYAADDRTCEYFAVHTTADVHHSRVWRNLIDRCVENDPACASEVLDGVRQAAQALWVALDGIEAARLQLD
jgi:pyrroloquinoline quinone (PQQ) biosynthesis protein C